MWQEYGGHSPPCKNDMWMPRSLRMSSDLHLDCIAIPWAEFLRDGSIQTSQSPDSALKSQAHGTYFQLDNHVAYSSLPVASVSTQVATLAFGACLGYMAARVITKGCVVGGDSSSFRMVRGRYLQIFAWRMVMEDVFICFYCHLLRARCKEQEASSDGRLLLFYFRVACESRCTKLSGFFWRHTHSSVSGISEKEFYPESHPGSLATAMHRTRSMDSAQSQRCYWTAGVVWLQIPSRSDPILFEMDWLTLIENWFSAWVSTFFYLERHRIRYMTRMEHFVECIVGSQSWHVYAVKRSELSSERFNAAFSVGHGFVQTSEVLAKIPVLHGYIPMESQEPGKHGIQIWEFLEINSIQFTFLHVSPRFSTFTLF